MEPLTRRQREIYEYLRDQQGQHAYPTSLDALCEALNLRSRGSLHKHIQALVKHGLVAASDKKQRGIRLLDPPAASESEGLPMLGYIAAGRPIEAVPDTEYVEVPMRLRTSKPCFVLRVKGDSMTEDGILEGDQIVVEQRDTARNGEIVVALIDGQETTLKRIEQRSDKVILHPANARYQPLELAPDRVAIQGIVVGLIRAYR